MDYDVKELYTRARAELIAVGNTTTELFCSMSYFDLSLVQVQEPVFMCDISVDGRCIVAGEHSIDEVIAKFRDHLRREILNGTATSEFSESPIANATESAETANPAGNVERLVDGEHRPVERCGLEAGESSGDDPPGVPGGESSTPPW